MREATAGALGEDRTLWAVGGAVGRDTPGESVLCGQEGAEARERGAAGAEGERPGQCGGGGLRGGGVVVVNPASPRGWALELDARLHSYILCQIHGTANTFGILVGTGHKKLR